MHTNRGVHAVMLLGELGRVDHHHAIDTGPESALDGGIAVGVELFGVNMAVRIDQDHFRRAPMGMSSRKPARTGLPPSTDAATIIPLDSMPFSLRGCRFATITTLRLTSCSGEYASAIPATSVRGCASPMS